MSNTKASRRTAIFWLASGGIFFFMDMEILGESAIAQPVEQVCQVSQIPSELTTAVADFNGEPLAVVLVSPAD